MAENGRLRRDAEIMDKLGDFLAYPGEEEDIEQVRASLVEGGIDPDGAVSRVLAFVEEKKKEGKQSWREAARRKSEEMQEKLRRASSRLHGSREELLERFHELFSRGPALAFFRNMNLNEMSDEELMSLLARLEVLEKDEGGAVQ